MYHEFKHLLLRAQNRRLFCMLNNYKTTNSRSFKNFYKKLCKHNQKEIESLYGIKVYAKVVLRNNFVYAETSDMNLLITFQVIDSPERL